MDSSFFEQLRIFLAAIGFFFFALLAEAIGLGAKSERAESAAFNM